MNRSLIRIEVLGIPVNAISWENANLTILGWAKERQSRTVVIANVHVVVTGSAEPDYGKVLHQSDLTVSDGAPIAWMLRRLGFHAQTRIAGPDLMWELCRRAAAQDIGIYLLGGTEATLKLLRDRLASYFPGLRIVGTESPPFRPLTEMEDHATVARINQAAAGLIFVGLGCPKQERWIASHRGKVQGVMLGVGAAFDFHAGTVLRAPSWMRRMGLEWLHRLASEPRRLWKRYLITNSVFIAQALKQLLRVKFQGAAVRD